MTTPSLSTRSVRDVESSTTITAQVAVTVPSPIEADPSPFGDLTIYSLITDDTDHYYYNIEPANGPIDPGNQYEIYLDVKGE